MSHGKRVGKRADAARAVVSAMRRGQHLICEQREHEIRWYLSDGRVVPCSAAELVLADANVAGVRDCLFPDTALSQTYWWRP
jgi:hypothetical protein